MRATCATTALWHTMTRDAINYRNCSFFCCLYIIKNNQLNPKQSKKGCDDVFAGHITNCNHEVHANTMQALKALASKAANERNNTVDTMIVINDMGLPSPVTLRRINRKAPNGTIKRGVWK